MFPKVVKPDERARLKAKMQPQLKINLLTELQLRRKRKLKQLLLRPRLPK